MSQTVQCNSCSELFLVAIKTIKLPNSLVEESFFRCPQCQAKYTAFYTDKSIRKLQARQRAIAKSVDQARDAQKRESLSAEFDANKHEIKRQMDALCEHIETK